MNSRRTIRQSGDGDKALRFTRFSHPTIHPHLPRASRFLLESAADNGRSAPAEMSAPEQHRWLLRERSSQQPRIQHLRPASRLASPLIPEQVSCNQRKHRPVTPLLKRTLSLSLSQMVTFHRGWEGGGITGCVISG